MSLISRAAEFLRRHRQAAFGLGIAAMAAAIVATLLWSEERRGQFVVKCEPSPALSADGATRALYLIRVATAPSPEDSCAELRRKLETSNDGGAR